MSAWRRNNIDHSWLPNPCPLSPPLYNSNPNVGPIVRHSVLGYSFSRKDLMKCASEHQINISRSEANTRQLSWAVYAIYGEQASSELYSDYLEWNAEWVGEGTVSVPRQECSKGSRSNQTSTIVLTCTPLAEAILTLYYMVMSEYNYFKLLCLIGYKKLAPKFFISDDLCLSWWLWFSKHHISDLVNRRAS